MTCHHRSGDPDCSATKFMYESVVERQKNELKERNQNFTIQDVWSIGDHLILKVKYESCPNCTFEGVKVLVYLNTTMQQAIKWRTIDPHFREKKPGSAHEAPGPDARFPASVEGISNAVRFAKMCGSEQD